MQALKALVIFMGVLIVIGMGVLAYGLMMKFDEWQAKKQAAPETPVAVEAPAPAASAAAAPAEAWPSDLKIAVPAGARVAETVIGEGRMIVRLVLPDDSQRFLVFDIDAGRRLGAIELQPGAAAQ